MVARSTIGPSTRPVSAPSTASSRFACTRVIGRSATSGSTISWKPPETSPTGQPRSANAATSSSAPGVNEISARAASNASTPSPASVATRSRSDAAKSSSPRIARSVIAATRS